MILFTRRLCLCATLGMIALLPASSMFAQDTAQEDARLATRFQEWLDDQCKRHPMFATYLGNHDYDNQIDDLSPQARASL